MIRPWISIGSKDDDSRYIIDKINRGFTEIISKTKPAVVTIKTIKKIAISDPKGEKRKIFKQKERKIFEGEIYGINSGIIVKEDGYILTNDHVIKDAEEITVILADSRKFKAEIEGRDKKTNLAIIKIDEDNLPALPLGDSNKLEVGEWVIAIGNTSGYAQTVTRGVCKI